GGRGGAGQAAKRGGARAGGTGTLSRALPRLARGRVSRRHVAAPGRANGGLPARRTGGTVLPGVQGARGGRGAAPGAVGADRGRGARPAARRIPAGPAAVAAVSRALAVAGGAGGGDADPGDRAPARGARPSRPDRGAGSTALGTRGDRKCDSARSLAGQ